MDIILAKTMSYIGSYGALIFSTIGAAYGTKEACAAAIGAWKKCYALNKPAPFQLIIFGSSPISQIIYGMIIMFIINDKIIKNVDIIVNVWPVLLVVGLFSGISLGIASWAQGVIGAMSSDSFGENNKGFVNLLMMVGIVETVSIFTMAFSIVLVLSV